MSELDLALAFSVSKLRIYNDSQLVMGHVQKEYEVKGEHMSQYLTKVRDTPKQLNEWAIEKFPRANNMRVDALVGIVASLPVKEVILLPIHVQLLPPLLNRLSTALSNKARNGRVP